MAVTFDEHAIARRDGLRVVDGLYLLRSEWGDYFVGRDHGRMVMYGRDGRAICATNDNRTMNAVARLCGLTRLTWDQIEAECGL